MIRFGPLLFLIVLVLPAAQAAAEEKVGLVLSGGGARGLAHIGVIRALEERNIKIHAIAGTSMGAVIGALYASGRTPDQLEQIALNLDWGQTLNDQPAREQLTYRRKRDSRKFPTRTQASTKNGVLSLPKGVVQGQNLQLLLQKQFLHVVNVTDFDELQIPFRAVAGDLETGKPVVLGSGSLTTAVHASMAIPGFFAPVELNGKMLADGGIANNLPVDVVKKMGVDRVIAVDITTPLYKADEMDSIIPIVEQLTTLLTYNQQKKQYALLTEDDILLKPDLETVHTTDFNKADAAIAQGYDTVAARSEELTAFKADTPINRETPDRYSPPLITEIDIQNDSSISNKLIRAQITQETGQKLDRNQLEEDLEAIYGYEHFESVNYNLVSVDSGNRLLIRAKEKSWGNDLMGVNFELTADSEGDSAYNLGLSFRKSGITRKGGESFTIARVGENPMFRSEFYLPLDYRQIFFAEPYVGYAQRNFNDVRNADIQARYRIDNFVYGSFFGIEVSNTAIVGTGIEDSRGEVETFIGTDPDSVNYRNRNHYYLLEVDTLNNIYFPNHGTLAQVRYDQVDPRTGGHPEFELLSFSGLRAFGVGRHSLVLQADYVRSYGEISGRHFQQSLGGFLKLSGMPEQALVGSDLAWASLAWLHRLDQQSILPVDLPVYVGLSLEAGNVWQSHSEVSASDLVGAGAVMMGVDSPLGGIYFGYGRAEGGENSLYLKLGRLF